MKSAWPLLLALIALGVTTHAQAQGRDHDGFMMRFTAGPGFTGIATQTVGRDYTLGGFGGSFSVDLGGAPVENLIIHGRFLVGAVAEPTAAVDDTELGTVEDSSLNVALLGPAITYYFMPINLYLTGSLGAAVISVQFEEETGRTNVGFGANGDVGIEFWLGAHATWALGAAIRTYVLSTSDDGLGTDDVTWVGAGIGLVFSATYQ